jgi:hypothetical protein
MSNSTAKRLEETTVYALYSGIWGLNPDRGDLHENPIATS